MARKDSVFGKKWTMEKLDDCIKWLKEYIVELETEAEGVTGKIQEVVQLGNSFGRFDVDISSYHRPAWSLLGSWKSAANIATQTFDAKKKEVDEAHEKNLSAIENNKALRKKVELMMHAIGIPDSWSERDWKSRARTPKYIKHTAGYLSDIQRCCPVDDGYESACVAYKRFQERVEKYIKDNEAADIQAQRAQEAKGREEKRERIRAALVVKLGLPYDSPAEDALEHLLSKNKLLNLAHAMQKTRGDWNEGAYRVENALFSPENDTEKAINADVASYLEDFEDGRVFRDCTWNYNRIFSLIAETDPELVSDYQQACEAAEDW